MRWYPCCAAQVISASIDSGLTAPVGIVVPRYHRRPRSFDRREKVLLSDRMGHVTIRPHYIKSPLFLSGWTLADPIPRSPLGPCHRPLKTLRRILGVSPSCTYSHSHYTPHFATLASIPNHNPVVYLFASNRTLASIVLLSPFVFFGRYVKYQ